MIRPGLVAVSLVLAGCPVHLVPVGAIDAGTAGPECLSSECVGVPFDAGPGDGPLTVCDSSLPDSLALVGERLTHLLRRCDITSSNPPRGFRVIGPSPVTDASLVFGFSAQVTFAAWTPGIYRIEVEFPQGLAVRNVVVLRPEPIAQQTQRFVDRMDSCQEGPYRSRTGMTYCSVAGTIYEYGLDGSLVSQFSGTWLRVLGNEVWSAVDDGSGAKVEHRTALEDAGLRFDGRGNVPVQGWWFGEVRPSLLTMAGEKQVVLTTFDGGEVVSTPSGIPVPEGPVAFIQGNAAINGKGCAVTPGCSSRPDCEPVVACATDANGEPLFIDWTYFTFSPAGVFGGSQMRNYSTEDNKGRETVQFRYRPRPIELKAPLTYHYESERSSTWLKRAPGLDWPALAMEGDVLLVPEVASDGGLTLHAFRTAGYPRNVTDDFVISVIDPFTLAYGPPPRLDRGSDAGSP